MPATINSLARLRQAAGMIQQQQSASQEQEAESQASPSPNPPAPQTAADFLQELRNAGSR